MNRLSRFHDALAIISVSAPLTGLFVGAGPSRPEQYVLCILMILLRLKFWIDDIDFFESADQTGGKRDFWFSLGLGFGVLSWVALTIAGLSVLSLAQAGVFLFFGMVLSTLWVIIELCLKRGQGEQARYLAFNIAYLISFWLIWRHSADELARVGLAIMGLALAVDIAISRVVEKILKP